MKIGNSVGDFTGRFEGCIASIGNFDGVHIGHRRILARIKERAREEGRPSLAITFEPHPSSVLYPARSVTRLTAPEKKCELIGQLGIDGVLAIPFTLEFARKSPRAFVEETLYPLGVRELYVGHDFSFGAGRAGDVESLRREGALIGFEIFEIGEVYVDGEPVRSSRIRKYIAEGAVDRAAVLLGRHHSVTGRVVKGHGRGKTLGFPTANLGDPAETVPGAGIYATRTYWRGKLYDSVTHVGVIPTFDVDIPGIETFLFDFEGDMRGGRIELFFIRKFRGTKKFGSPDELKNQIAKDCEKARELLAGEEANIYIP